MDALDERRLNMKYLIAAILVCAVTPVSAQRCYSPYGMRNTNMYDYYNCAGPPDRRPAYRGYRDDWRQPSYGYDRPEWHRPYYGERSYYGRRWGGDW
jgi:hypothetical protein